MRVKKFLLFLLKLALSALFAIFASLAFPTPVSDEGWGFLAFFYLIPVFLLVRKSSFPEVFAEGLVYGFVFYLRYNYWLATFHPLAILIAPILESVQYLCLFPCLKAGSSLFKKRGYLAQTFLYLAYLYLTQQGFLGYPYGNISAAMYLYTPMMQICSITGIWGLCFLLVLPQTLAAEIIDKKAFTTYKIDFVIALSLLVLNFIYGCFVQRYYENKAPDREIRITAVQHSADTWENGYTTYRRNFETLKGLSLEALEAGEEPDMITWSETAFVPSVTWHESYPSNQIAYRMTQEFVAFGKSLPVPLVTGNPEGVIKDESLPPYLEDGSWNWKTYNTVILFGDGEVLGTYRKQHLVPFTEYFPYEKQFPRLYQLLKDNDYKWWELGYEAKVFEYDGVKFSTPICFEDIFGYLSASFVRAGADLLLNMTNDVWSGAVAAEVQHMQLAAFRAVENRRPLLRSTNSGITCLVTPSGRIIEAMEPFTVGYNTYTIPLADNPKMTFYTRHPDLFAKLFVFLAFSSVILGLCQTVQQKRREKYSKYDYLFETFDDFYEV